LRTGVPSLTNVTLVQMERVTGLSKRSCSRIKHGWVPHPMHWAGLEAVALGSDGARSVKS